MNRPADTQSPQETSPGAIRPKPKRRRLRRALIALALAAAVPVAIAVLAPSILSLGVCRGLVVDQVNSRVPVRLAVKDLSLSWFGRQEVSNLTVETAQGKRVAAVGQASLDQGLWNLVTDGTRLGAVYAKDIDVWTDGVAQLRESLAAQAPESESRPPAPPAAGPPAASRSTTS
jgi:hypothetical protein